MKKVKIVFCCVTAVVLIIGIVAFNFSIVTISQSNKEIGFKGIDFVESSSLSSQDTEIYSSSFPINYNSENVEEFILAQPLPNIWIIQKNTGMADKKIIFSDQVREVLLKHWRSRLKYNYLTTFIGSSKDINYQKEDTILLQSFIDTKDNLTNMPITSEEESRNFSSEEAYQVLGIIRDNSEKLVKVIKEAKKIDAN